MAEYNSISVRVISQKGTCDAGHRVGDEWVIEDKTPEGICAFAFTSLFHLLTPLMFGGAFPWEDDSDVTTVAYPDPANPVVFELRRLR